MAEETLLYRYEESGLDDLRRETKKLAEDFEDVGDEATQAGAEVKAAMEGAEDSVEELDDRAIDFDVRAALASLQRVSGALDDIERKIDHLDGRTIDIDSDVDRERVGGAVSGGGGDTSRRGARLPGELDEVQEGVSFLGALPPKVKALIGATVAATAALGAGAGLAGVATRLANELGPRGLQNDVKGLSATYKEVGRDFASAFDDVIRGQVLTTLRGFADIIQAVDDDLAAFSGEILKLLRLTPGLGNVIAIAQGLGQDRDTGDLVNRQLRKALKPLRIQVPALRRAEDADPGFSQQDELQQRISALEKVRDKLFQLQQQFPDVVLATEEFPRPFERVLKLLQKSRSELQSIENRSFDGPGFRSGDITARDAGHGDAPLIEQEPIDFDATLPGLDEELDRLTTTFGEKLRNTTAKSLSRGFNRAFQTFGRTVAQGIFGGGRGPSVASQRLRLFNAKKQMRSLRQALRQGQISYRAFSLRVKVQQRRIQKQQKRLNDTMQGGFVGALEDMGDAMKRIGKQLIAEITAVIAKMAVLKALATAFGISSGGFLGTVFTQLGGGSFLSKSGGAAASSVAAPTPKMRTGGLRLAISGTLEGDGRSIKATLDRQANAQSQFGR